MIVISDEGELVRIESWEDMIDRQRYRDNMKSSNVQLKEVIGKYDLPWGYYCGLVNCRTVHKKGYFILTEGGHEINIGHCCGSKYFGLHFKHLARALDRSIEARDNRELLTEHQSRVDHYLGKIGRLKRRHDIGIIHDRLKLLTNKRNKFPKKIAETLLDMVKRRDATIRIETRLSDTEAQAINEANAATASAQGKSYTPQRQMYRSEVIGKLRSLDALYPSNNFHNLIYKELFPLVRDLKNLNIDTTSDREIKGYLKILDNIEGRIEHAENCINKAKQFLDPANVMQLYPLVASHEGSERFKGFCEISLTSFRIRSEQVA